MKFGESLLVMEIGHGVVVLPNLGTNGMTAKSWASVINLILTRQAGSRY